MIATVLLTSCDFGLGLDILNATNEPITVAVGTTRQSVQPGLSFHGRFPEKSTFSISSGNCVRVYAVPNLDAPPWKFLIGNSVKLRAMPTDVLLAYPPTPDVALLDNPLRASSGTEAQLRPVRQTCR